MTTAVMEPQTLSDREQDILRFIEEFILEYGFPPSLREIMRGIEVSSTSVASYHIRRLERKGVLEFQPNTSRGIRLLTSRYREPDDAFVSVPLLRRIIRRPKIGVPESQWKQSIPIHWVRGVPIKAVYAVALYSERLYDAMVNTGDVIVLHCTDRASEGDTALMVVQPEQQLRIRRVHFEGDAVRLVPLMKQLQPHVASRQDVHILGRVLGMMREF
jgi:repressor LexA